MFKPKVALPSGVEVLRRYDRKEIDGQTSTLRFFRPDATQEDTVDNYVKNPLPGNRNHVVLALSVGLIGQSIVSNDDVDPISVINNLKDSVLKIETNGGREERILHPLKDYMNFAQTRVAYAAATDNTTDAEQQTHSIVTLQATGPRYIDNLFYFEPNEAFKAEILFGQGTFPDQAQFDDKFGLEVELFLAQMNDNQLKRYEQKLIQAGA